MGKTKNTISVLRNITDLLKVEYDLGYKF